MKLVFLLASFRLSFLQGDDIITFGSSKESISRNLAREEAVSWGDEDLRLCPAHEDSTLASVPHSLCSQDHGFGYGPQLQGLSPALVTPPLPAQQSILCPGELWDRLTAVLTLRSES